MDFLAEKAIAPKWVRKYLHDLPSQELELVRESLGYLPWDADSGGVETLFARVRAGRVHLLATEDPEPSALFFELQKYPGGLNLHVCAWVALGEKVGKLARFEIPTLDALAKALHCGSISLETIRPGLVELLTQHGFRATSVICRKVLERGVHAADA